MFTPKQLQTLKKRLLIDIATHQLHNPLSLYATLQNALGQTGDDEIIGLILSCMDLIAQAFIEDALEANGWTCLTVNGHPFWHHP